MHRDPITKLMVKDKWDDFSTLEVLNLLAEQVDLPYELYSVLFDKIKRLEPAKVGETKYYLNLYDENHVKKIQGPHEVTRVMRKCSVYFDNDGGRNIPGSQVYDTLEEAQKGQEVWKYEAQIRKEKREAERARKAAEKAAKEKAEAEAKKAEEEGK